MYDIILGRSQGDVEKLGTKGAVMIGKQYVQMGQTSSLSNPIYMDVSRAHAMLIVGKRGGGKSYTMGSIAEGLADLDPEVSKNLAFMLLDTMGVYWSMKYPNKKEEEMLKKWGLEGKSLTNIQTYVPGGFYEKYKEDGVPVDFPFFIQPKELSIEDWMRAFELKTDDEVGVAIQRVVNRMLDSGDNFDLDDIVKSTQNDDRLDDKIKLAVENRFENAKTWGIFSKNGTPIRDLFTGGKVTVMDLSPYVAMPGGWQIKALVLGIISKRTFVERMLVRKREELFDIVNKTQVIGEEEVKEDLPMPWLIVDECLPYDTIVKTNRGDMKIGDIVDKDNDKDLQVLSYNREKDNFEYNNVTKRYRKGIKKIIEIKTETGKILKCTPDHKIYSRRGFIEAGKAASIALPTVNNYSKEVRAVRARLVGSIYGDGWMSAGQVGFSSNNESINLERIKKDLEILGFNSGNIYYRKTKSSFKRIGSEEISIEGDSYSINVSTNGFQYFKELGVKVGSKVNSETFVPEFIINGNNLEKREFLGGLFGADANIISQSNKWRSDFNPVRLVFYRQENLIENGKIYANQIRKLLNDLGIQTSNIAIRRGNLRKDNTKSMRFEITIAKKVTNMINFLDHVGYRYSDKKERTGLQWLAYLKKRRFSLLEKENLKEKALTIRKEESISSSKIAKRLNIENYQVKEWISNNSNCSLSWKFPSFKEWINKRSENDIIYEKIVSKKELGETQVYDISVDKVHNFIADEFVVHNCHEFLPRDGEAPSSDALITILREGRQPGVSLIMATQQPAKIHTDAITQSDIVLAHRLTASFDLEALDRIFLSYDNKGSKALFNSMPRTKGCAIIMDDKNERLHTMQVKPRFTWHGGEDPNAIREVKDDFDLD